MSNNSIAVPPTRLTGEALARMFEKQLSELQPGCTLTITSEGLVALEGVEVAAPAYPHKRWRDEANNKLCIRRLERWGDA